MRFSFRKSSLTKQIVLAGTAAIVLVTVGYALYLDHLVTRQFEGRRWTLPAQPRRPSR